MTEINKIIHQLWIGDKPAPIRAMDSIRRMNPTFQYMFWNETLIKEKLIISPRYKRKIEDHSAIWGRADMYRYLILEQYGGVFIDADMVAIEPLDDFLLNKAFFCWENEIARPELCATSIQGYPPHHIIPRTAIEWIMNNNVNVEKTRIQSWILVGPGLLTKVYSELIEDKSVVNVLPSYLGLPDHHTGSKYLGHGKVYMSHEWGSTRDNYKSINDMNIPDHHMKPKDTIEIYIPKCSPKKIKEYMKSIKSMEGHFNIKINCDSDISKYLKSMRFISQNKNISTDDGLVGYVDDTLTDIMNEAGSDKGQGRHNYTTIYEELFESIRYNVKTFCEIGLGTTNPTIKSNMGSYGIPLASVRGWRKYFKNADIYGGDIDKDILRNEERIKTYSIDMTDIESISHFWKNFTFKHDIIMDDGLHEYDANVLLFENSYSRFNQYYIIEDIGEIYLDKWKKKIEEWIEVYPELDFKLMINPIPSNTYDNNLIVISKV